MPVIMEFSATNLSVGRAGSAVLADVSFQVRAGRALVLRGPNGIGKTTLLRCIAGLQPAMTGQISVDAQLVAYAAHADGLKSTLTVGENLAFWAAVFGTSNVANAMSAFALQPLADRPAAHLSAGQKRRLGLARLLVTGRPVWTLDEPTVSLDADAVQMFAAVVLNHLAAGGSALIATHVNLGLDADELDLAPYRANHTARRGVFDTAFE